MSTKSLLNILESLARKSPMKDKMAAALVYKGKIISTGYNNYCGQYRKVFGSKVKTGQLVLQP